ncbi:MAG: hypothetical protein AB7W28_00650 [Armatimonadota bacterium]
MRSGALVVLLVLAVGLAWSAEDFALIEQDPQAFRVKVGWADLGDFDDGVTVAVEYGTPEFLATFGWADAGGLLTDSMGMGYSFDGDYWFGEATYTFRPPANPLMYVGCGLGWYCVDGDFVESGNPANRSSGDDSSIGGHVVVGVESENRRYFGEIRWIFGTEHWSWDSDGLRAYVGLRF